MRPCLAPAFLSLSLLAAPQPDRAVERLSCPALTPEPDLTAERPLSPFADLAQTDAIRADRGWRHGSTEHA
jgi:hypothetical protein